MLDYKTKWYIFKILPFGIIWMVFGFMYTIIERGLLGESKIYPATDNPYDFLLAVSMVVPGSFLLGILVGILEVFYLDHKLDKYSLWLKLIIKVIIYVGLIMTFLVTLTLCVNSINLQASPFNAEVIASLENFASAFVFWTIVIYSGLVITVILYFSETQTSLGQKMSANFFLGKYHRPKQESRIFMFLDMKSSTTIAEKMGHVKYYELLNDYYATMTNPIINTNGEIYQYVGDEVIITWEESEGLKNGNCITCFKKIKQKFHESNAYFIDNYGLVPQFKAGIHTGPVTTGEIGTLKKEIVYTGDVLNTAARIQGLCNDYDADLLISEPIFDLLKIEKPESEKIGALTLKGKEKEIGIVKVNFDLN